MTKRKKRDIFKYERKQGHTISPRKVNYYDKHSYDERNEYAKISRTYPPYVCYCYVLYYTKKYYVVRR